MPPELGTEGKGAGVIPWMGSLAERLRQTVDHHDRRAAEVLGLAFEDTEQPVVASICAADPDLVEAGHVVVHRLPFASSREGRRGSGSHGIEDGVDLCPCLEGHAVEKLDGGDGPGRVVRLGSLEEVNQPRRSTGHASSKLDTCNGSRA